MAKLYTGGFEVVGLGGSWHGVTGNAGSVSFASDRKGYGPGVPGTFVPGQCVSLSHPALPRSVRPHLHAGRLRAVRHAIDGRTCRSDRRAGDQRRRRHRSAGGLFRSAAAGNAQARHAADLRRSANGVRPAGTLVRRVAPESDSRHHDRVEDARRRHSACRRSRRTTSNPGVTSGASRSTRRTCRTRCPPPSGSPCSRRSSGRISLREVVPWATTSPRDCATCKAVTRKSATCGAWTPARDRARSRPRDARAARAGCAHDRAMPAARAQHEHSPSARARVGGGLPRR